MFKIGLSLELCSIHETKLQFVSNLSTPFASKMKLCCNIAIKLSVNLHFGL